MFERTYFFYTFGYKTPKYLHNNYTTYFTKNQAINRIFYISNVEIPRPFLVVLANICFAFFTNSSKDYLEFSRCKNAVTKTIFPHIKNKYPPDFSEG